jgi:hypothetical protein
MASIIKRSTGILTLKVTLLTYEQQLELSLERFRHGENVLESVWRAPLDQFAIPPSVSQASQAIVRLPESVVQGLRDAVEAAAEYPYEALWLHLVKPYGLLGALDWESALIEALGRPIFRLPDFLEPLRYHPDKLNIALICDLPTDEPPFDVFDCLRQLIETLLAAVDRPTTFHIFAPEPWGRPSPTFDAMRQEYPHLDLLYPVPASPGEDWLAWVARSLDGQAVDWVQFLAHADAYEGAACLAFAAHPSHGRRGATTDYLLPAEIGQVLNLISAWGVGFANPPGVSPDPLRYFADAVAQTRAGPVLFECLGRDDWRAALASRMGALFEPYWPNAGANAYAGGFLYVQPERLGLALSDAQRGPPTSLSIAMASGVVQPGWALSANSFLATTRQEWGLGTALGSLSAPQTLSEPGVWQANTVGAFERIELKTTGGVLGAAEDTLKALADLTAQTLDLKGKGF